MRVAQKGRVQVGVDMVSVGDVAASISRFGDRYLCRVYTEHERACCEGAAEMRAAGLAARFAAKEATLKVLRPVGARPDWRSIEVCRRRGGACDIRLSGQAARLAVAAGIDHLAVSLTHEGPYAAAVVVATSIDPPTGVADGGDGDLGADRQWIRAEVGSDG